MSLYIVIKLLFSVLIYKFSDFFFNNETLLIKKRKKASSIASITLFNDFFFGEVEFWGFS